MTDLPCSACPGRARLENKFLNPPGFDLARHDLVWIAAIHHVHHLEPRQDLSRVAELAQYLAVQLGFVDLARGLPGPRLVSIRIRIGEKRVLVRACRNT